jgi:hypothetical protein
MTQATGCVKGKVARDGTVAGSAVPLLLLRGRELLAHLMFKFFSDFHRCSGWIATTLPGSKARRPGAPRQGQPKPNSCQAWST